MTYYHDPLKPLINHHDDPRRTQNTLLNMQPPTRVVVDSLGRQTYDPNHGLGPRRLEVVPCTPLADEVRIRTDQQMVRRDMANQIVGVGTLPFGPR